MNATPTPSSDLQRAGELARELVEVLGRLGVDVSETSSDVTDRAPAAWFTRQTLITAEQLRKAHHRGAIEAEKIGGRWLYAKSDARQLWPDRWIYPRTGRAPQ
ncbi:MAG TPA: hypothetical protein VIL86_07195 [Tepidisphaeraceae bacterium]|jgi:hypothetical protein